VTSAIIHIIKQLTDLDESEIAAFIEVSKIKTYAAKTNFITAGHIPIEFGFVLNGLFRYVYSTAEGNEFTKGFMPENNFVSSYSAMISDTRSFFHIEAIENSKVLVISYHDWLKLKAKNPKWNVLLIKLLEKGYAVKEKREREFLLLDAQSRYKIFLKEYPTLETRVKQYMIASYLGITPIALSRVRKKMKP